MGRDGGDDESRRRAGFAPDDLKTVAEDPDELESITEEPEPARPRGVPARPPTHRIFVTGARVRPIIDDDDDDDALPPPPVGEAPADRPTFDELPPTAAMPDAEPSPKPESEAQGFAPPPVTLPDATPGDAAAATMIKRPAPAPDKSPNVRLVAGSEPDAPPASAPPVDDGHIYQLKAGDVVGDRYEIVRPIARGGMAEVYLAQQTGFAGFSKQVVIKRILPEFVRDKLFIEHFVREAHLASSLTHDHVAQVLDLGKDRDGYYLAMEYIPGVTLNELAQRGWQQGRSFPVELALLAMADAAEGLVYGWRTRGADGKPMRLVHRDISPDNLMVNTHGTTKVLDYGVAKAGDSADLTTAGEIKGKIAYVPPELILEHARDHRSDLYALGVTGYWLCTGEKPFTAENPTSLIHRILKEAPVAPRELNPHLPPVVEALLLKLLAKAPDDRFADGRALSEHVHRLLGAVRRASLGRFVADVMDDKKRRAVPTAEPPPAVVTVGLSGGSSETPTGEWDKG